MADIVCSKVADAAAAPTTTIKATRPRRAYHTKAKTGCRTCRIRRVRCDEHKPSCVRCTSTGRTCDGYDSLSPSSSPSSSSSAVSASPSPPRSEPLNAAADLRLTLPRQNSQEVRSYHYFLQVTAPSLAGAFHSDFWLAEVPRVCLSDAAIWHAIVSLASAHEDFADNGRSSESSFALKQFNSAIRCLTESRSPRHADRWRALIVSTIFTYICTIKGLHDQTRVHLQAGCNLLREIQNGGPTSLKQDQLQTGSSIHTENWISSIPIAIAPIESILTNLELNANALDRGGLAGNPALLSQNKILNAWRSYTAPQTPSCLTPEDVNRTYRAAESLSSGLILFSQEHAKLLGDLQAGKAGLEGLSVLVARQESHTRCFQEIRRAIDLFQQEISRTPDSPARPSRLEPHTILPLRYFHATNRLLLIEDPDEPDQIKRQHNLPALYTSIVDLAEEIMSLDPDKTRGVSYTQQLVLVAHSGIGQSTRRRAIALLKKPRLESGWDSLISASLAEAMMDREREATWEYQMEQGLDPETPGVEADEDEVDPMSRIFNITFTFTGSREARAVLRTWREKINDVPGKPVMIRW
ncbi:hypothetical protein CC79DRAFT_582197 [Sarocladium strictum]